jgi:hypothetical protein
MTRKHTLGKRGVKHAKPVKKIVHGAVHKPQRKQEENLQLRNYLMEAHPEFEPYAGGTA